MFTAYYVYTTIVIYEKITAGLHTFFIRFFVGIGPN